MNYTTASIGGNSLTYAIKQISHNVDNAILKSLNTSPFQILGAGYNYTVINAILDYDCNANSATSNFFIGYESLLGATISSAFCDFDSTLIIPTTRDVLGIGTKSRNFWTATSNNVEPLVLWQSIDDSTANYVKFQLTITYIEYP